MKYRMKNDLSKKVDKDRIINSDLLPNIQDICKKNVAEVKAFEIEEICNTMDKFEDRTKKLD